jgi:NAD(P)-dependent dehydrogenase (short-subunit alcohol dehydrogenase family)
MHTKYSTHCNATTASYVTDLTEADVTAHVQQYIKTYEKAAAAAGVTLPKLSDNGYWLQAYGFSKAALNAWTRVFAAGRGSDYVVAACCPGFVRTNMTQEYDNTQTLR